MKSSALAKLNTVFLSIALLAFSASGLAAGGNYSSDVDFKPIMKMIDQGRYESAIDMLYDELDVDPDNPDIMALLGFSYRKTQNYDDALTFYQWALKAEPDHIGANEYLGELYLETNQVDKAIEQLQILDNLCRNNCKEYSKLKQMIDSSGQSASNS